MNTTTQLQHAEFEYREWPNGQKIYKLKKLTNFINIGIKDKNGNPTGVIVRVGDSCSEDTLIGICLAYPNLGIEIVSPVT